MKDIKYEIAARRSGGDPAVLVASCEKAKKVLGWTPPKSPELEKIISDAWKWHKICSRKKQYFSILKFMI